MVKWWHVVCNTISNRAGPRFQLPDYRDRRSISFFWKTDTDISIFFTDIWPAADIRLVTDTDIPKFAYRYIFRYLNEEF